MNILICRICLGVCESGTNYNFECGNPSIRVMLGECMPYMDLLIIKTPRVCRKCMESLNHSFELIKNIKSTEELISKYMEGKDKTQSIDINAILDFETIQAQNLAEEEEIIPLKQRNSNKKGPIVTKVLFEVPNHHIYCRICNKNCKTAALLKKHWRTHREHTLKQIKINITNAPPRKKLKIKNLIDIPANEVIEIDSDENNDSNNSENDETAPIVKCNVDLNASNHCDIVIEDELPLETPVVNETKTIIQNASEHCMVVIDDEKTIKNETEQINTDDCTVIIDDEESIENVQEMIKDEDVSKINEDCTVIIDDEEPLNNKQLVDDLIKVVSSAAVKFPITLREPATFMFKKKIPKVKVLSINKKGYVNQGAYKCLQCEKQFNSHMDLLQHRVLHNTMTKIFKCNNCVEKFESLRELNVHRDWHAGFTSYYCDVCNKNFSRQAVLIEHMKTHRMYHMACLQCAKSFGDSQSVLEHTAQNPTHVSFVQKV